MQGSYLVNTSDKSSQEPYLFLLLDANAEGRSSLAFQIMLRCNTHNFSCPVYQLNEQLEPHIIYSNRPYKVEQFKAKGTPSRFAIYTADSACVALDWLKQTTPRQLTIVLNNTPGQDKEPEVDLTSLFSGLNRLGIEINLFVISDSIFYQDQAQTTLGSLPAFYLLRHSTIWESFPEALVRGAAHFQYEPVPEGLPAGPVPVQPEDLLEYFNAIAGAAAHSEQQPEYIDGKEVITSTAVTVAGESANIIPINSKSRVSLKPKSPIPLAKKNLAGRKMDWKRKSLALVASLLFICMVLLAGLNGVAQASEPGDSLYGVKLWFDGAGEFFAITPQAKASASLAYADHRLKEIESLVQNGKADKIEIATNEYHKAISNVLTVSGGNLSQDQRFSLNQQEVRLVAAKVMLDEKTEQSPAGQPAVKAKENLDVVIKAVNQVEITASAANPTRQPATATTGTSATPSPTNTPVPTATSTPVPTATSTPAPTNTPEPTSTLAPTSTSMPTFTAIPAVVNPARTLAAPTPVPPTPVPPTPTPVPPTPTPVPPTLTPVPPTPTPVPPTPTPVPPTPTPTVGPTPTPTVEPTTTPPTTPDPTTTPPTTPDPTTAAPTTPAPTTPVVEPTKTPAPSKTPKPTNTPKAPKDPPTPKAPKDPTTPRPA